MQWFSCSCSPIVARLFSLHVAQVVSVTASWRSPATSTPSRVLVPARITALTFCVPDKDSCLSHQTVWAAQRAHHNLLLPWLLHNPEGLYDYDDEGVWTLGWDYCRTVQQLGVDIFLSSPLTLSPSTLTRSPSWSTCRHGSSGGRLCVEENHWKHPGGVWVHGGAGLVSTFLLMCVSKSSPFACVWWQIREFHQL